MCKRCLCLEFTESETNRRIGEPNDAEKVTPENCEMVLQDVTWGDLFCLFTQTFVCFESEHVKKIFQKKRVNK